METKETKGRSEFKLNKFEFWELVSRMINYVSTSLHWIYILKLVTNKFVKKFLISNKNEKRLKKSF